MQINDQLVKLYEKEISILKNSNIKSWDFDGPLLMHCWEKEYLQSEFKILFFGREPNGWMGDLVLNTSDCINKYKDFGLCENGRYTTFWQYIYHTKNILMPQSITQKNFLWSNVSKFSKLNGKSIDLDSYKFFCDNFQILETELKILKPDVIIFFTGESWDDKIRYQINSEIQFKSVKDEIPISKLSRVQSEILPYNTYRVDHPTTLQLQKNWNYMEIIMEQIKLTHTK